MWLLPALAVAAEPDPVLAAATAEVDRAVAELKGIDDPPYYLGVEVTESDSVTITAEDGAIYSVRPSHFRRLDVDARVGTGALDSSHALRSGSGDEGGRNGRSLVLGDDVDAIRRGLWREIDESVRSARARWAKVEADRQTLVAEDAGPDLAPLTSVPVSIGPVQRLDFAAEPWEDRLRRVSAALATPEVRDGSVSLTAAAETRWFVSSEGVRIRDQAIEYRIGINADTLADDGTVISLYRSWQGPTPADLPDEGTLLVGAKALADQLAALDAAPDQDPYTGPVVLSDRAAGVFFHEIFGHRMEGHRLKRNDNAQTFKDMVGQAVLPTFLTVVDDPTRAEFAGIPLRGHYAFDDEGVPAQPVPLVENGVLRGFLQSRSPHAAGIASNGHGRAEPGKKPVARQGNLIVTASRSVGAPELRAALVKAAKDAGLPYGLWIDEIQGGFTYTDRGIPNAFQVNVLVARRIWVDGRPDQLVRGIDLIGTPLVAFSRIALAGPTTEVFNGSCGAESGWVPVSAVAPALLVSQVETQRKRKGQNTAPVIPAPVAATPP
jgi:hypothetical protein